MKPRSSHLPPYLLISLTTCAVIPTSLAGGNEEPDKVLIIDDIDSLLTSEQLEKMIPKKGSHSLSPFPDPLLIIPYQAIKEEDYVLLEEISIGSSRGHNLHPWEQSQNFTRPFAKGSSVRSHGKTRYQASRQKSQSIRTRRLSQ